MARWNDGFFQKKLQEGCFSHIADGYLYSMKTGVIMVSEGSVYSRNDINRHANQLEFVRDINTYPNGRVLCAASAGVVFNKALWLYERDDELAKQLFIESEKACIAKLEDEIRKHQAIIGGIKTLGVY